MNRFKNQVKDGKRISTAELQQLQTRWRNAYIELVLNEDAKILENVIL